MIHYAYQLCSALAHEGAEVTLITGTCYELKSLPHNFTVDSRMRLWSLHAAKSVQSKNPFIHLVERGFRLFRRCGRGLRLIREWYLLMRHLANEQPDIIQFGKIEFAFEAFFLKRLVRAGLILSQVTHEFEIRERSGLLAEIHVRFNHSVFSTFSALFFHEESNRNRFLSIFPINTEHTHVIPHGNEGIFRILADPEQSALDHRKRLGAAPDEPVVLFFGTLMPSKGLPDLLDAFAIARQDCVARLVIAGYPSKFIDIGALKAQAVQLGIESAVAFDTRYVPLEEVGPIMEMARVVVFPYRNATSSGVIQLSYTFARPVIATRVGSMAEVVEDGGSGFLVAPGDTAALAAAIVRLTQDDALARKMGAHAHHLSLAKYAWQPIARRILGVYSSLTRPQSIMKPAKTGIARYGS